MPKDVYIDLDGTLTDPFEGIAGCICYALDRLGETRPSMEELKRFIGPPLLDTFGELVGDERAPAALGYYRERFGDVGWRENVPYDGIHDALEAITLAGHRCFVATTKPHVYARRIVEYFGMGQYFVEVYGSPGELRDAGAHVLAESPADLANLLQLRERAAGTIDDRKDQK